MPLTPTWLPCQCPAYALSCALLQVEDTIYASDANSTAYQYPLADATILRVKGKPAGAGNAAADGCLEGAVRQLERLPEPRRCAPLRRAPVEPAHMRAACSAPAMAAARAVPIRLRAVPFASFLCAVEVPLDGTVYDLATGKVLSW